MSSVSPTNPGLAALLQTLGKVDSPLLSSSATMSALEKASPSDIVQISNAATQLAGMGALFGASADSTAGPGTDQSNLLADLEASLTGSGSKVAQATQSALKNASPADIVRLSVAAARSLGVEAMFGISDGSADNSGSEMSDLLANLNAAVTTSAASDATGNSSGTDLAKQFAARQTALQLAATEALLK